MFIGRTAFLAGSIPPGTPTDDFGVYSLGAVVMIVFFLKALYPDKNILIFWERVSSVRRTLFGPYLVVAKDKNVASVFRRYAEECCPSSFPKCRNGMLSLVVAVFLPSLWCCLSPVVVENVSQFLPSLWRTFRKCLSSVVVENVPPKTQNPSRFQNFVKSGRINRPTEILRNHDHEERRNRKKARSCYAVTK